MSTYTVIAEHLFSNVHTKTATGVSSSTATERVVNFTRIKHNKNKGLFVYCKIPCSDTDIN